MSLGSDIVIALNGLSEADKRDMGVVWEAIGDEIQKGTWDWDSTVTYFQNDFVSYAGIIYKSLQNSNLNKQPDTETTWWEEYPQVTTMPIGCVMMFDGTNWVDNSTMVGWYACIAANAGQGCPDMVDRFVMGKVVTGGGSTGGSNSMTITSAMLPTHTHTINHDHPVKTSGGPSSANTGIQSASHSHNTVIGQHRHYYAAQGSRSGAYAYLTYTATVVNQQTAYSSYTNLGTKGSGNQTVDHAHSMQSHTHDVDLDNFTGSSGNGGFANNAFNNRPAYYTMIFIRKCA